MLKRNKIEICMECLYEQCKKEDTYNELIFNIIKERLAKPRFGVFLINNFIIIIVNSILISPLSFVTHEEIILLIHLACMVISGLSTYTICNNSNEQSQMYNCISYGDFIHYMTHVNPDVKMNTNLSYYC